MIFRLFQRLWTLLFYNPDHVVKKVRSVPHGPVTDISLSTKDGKTIITIVPKRSKVHQQFTVENKALKKLNKYIEHVLEGEPDEPQINTPKRTKKKTAKGGEE